MSRLGTFLTTGAVVGPEYRDAAFDYLGQKLVYVKFGLPDAPLIFSPTLATFKIIKEIRKACLDSVPH